MVPSEDAWRAFAPRVASGPVPGQFRVIFETRGMTSHRDPGGEASRAPSPAEVIVSQAHGGNLEVIAFSGARSSILGLTQMDYEQRAVDLVREAIAAEQ